MSACYLDASSIVKLAADEAESAGLRDWLRERTFRLTSRVSSVEVLRALRRKGAASVENGTDALDAVLRSLSVIELDAPIADQAATLGPDTLRSLDAIHLASALAIGEQLEAFVTYDLRLADAARASGLTVVAPA